MFQQMIRDIIEEVKRKEKLAVRISVLKQYSHCGLWEIMKVIFHLSVLVIVEENRFVVAKLLVRIPNVGKAQCLNIRIQIEPQEMFVANSPSHASLAFKLHFRIRGDLRKIN